MWKNRAESYSSPAMEKWHGKVAMVTGASSGIGAAIASALVHHGMVVVGLARRDDKIKELAKQLVESKAPGSLHAIKADMRKEDDILAAFSWVETELGGADVLVNNAGFLSTSYLANGITEDWRNMLEVNLLAPAICSREYLKSMEKKNNQAGHIFMINSIAGHLAELGMLNVYTATKHGLKAISMCLRRELAEKKSTIKVTSVSPGATDTDMVVELKFMEELKNNPILADTDIAKAVVDSLSASPTSQICEVIINPVGSKIGLY